MPPNDRVQARGGCGVVPSRADPFVRVSPPPAGGEAASPATDVSLLFFTMNISVADAVVRLTIGIGYKFIKYCYGYCLSVSGKKISYRSGPSMDSEKSSAE